MRVQSLSVVTPGNACMNKCQFCVSRMNHVRNKDLYPRLFATNNKANEAYLMRLKFAKDSGCNTVMLTGTCEPQQNMWFLRKFGEINRENGFMFPCVEIQTTGARLTRDDIAFLRRDVGVSTVSLSVAALDDVANNSIICPPSGAEINLEQICEEIVDEGMNLRLSLNLTSWFDSIDAEQLFAKCRQLQAHQVTLRILYEDGSSSAPAQWVRDHAMGLGNLRDYIGYIRMHGRQLERLEYGRVRYSIEGLSTVIDDDCMAEEVSDVYKYLILRPNCKLYSKWDDPASLIF